MTQQNQMVKVTPVALVKQRMTKMIESLPAKLHKRFQQAAISACMAPGISACTPESVAKAIYVCARLNLIPDPVLQEAHIVPFSNHGTKEATFIAGYKGLIKLARNSDPGLEVRTGRVYQNDDYELLDGTEQRLVIKKRWWEKGLKEPGVFLFSFCVSRQGGADEPMLVTLSAQEGRDIGSKSKAGMKPGRPWHDNFEAMCDKTTVRRSAKLWTLDPDKEDTQRFRKAITMEESIEGEELPTDADDLLSEFEAEDATKTPPEGNVGMGNVGAAAAAAAQQATGGRPGPVKPTQPPSVRLITQIEEKIMALDVEPEKSRVLKVLAVVVGGVEEVEQAEEILKSAKAADILGFVQTLEALTSPQIAQIIA